MLETELILRMGGRPRVGRDRIALLSALEAEQTRRSHDFAVA